MMLILPYKLDGVDFTGLVHKYGYSVTYERIRGENDFVYLNGNEEEDVLQIKPIVVTRLNDAPSEQLSAFLAAACKDRVNLTYYDPRAKSTLTREALPSVDTVRILLSDGGSLWWSGYSVTMRVNYNV